MFFGGLNVGPDCAVLDRGKVAFMGCRLSVVVMVELSVKLWRGSYCNGRESKRMGCEAWSWIYFYLPLCRFANLPICQFANMQFYSIIFVSVL